MLEFLELPLIRRLRASASQIVARLTGIYVTVFWSGNNRKAQAHSLPGKLAVTLTSYPPRYKTLALTLKSLLAQSIRPDHIYLWIEDQDLALLPSEVVQLQAAGLEIRKSPSYRSFNKIVPALQDDPNVFLVTADDDQFYPRHWLRNLVEAYEPGQREVVCGRGHRIRLKPDGLPLPYFQWESEASASDRDRFIFPTGVGGVLYEPGIFHTDVTRSDIFRELCPSADDVWLYWMAALNGATFRKVGPRRKQVIWPSSQNVSLLSLNLTANDEQIARMIERYGFFT